jgi:hypothetical protein
MAQAVSSRPPSAEARFRSRVSPCRICGGQSGTGTCLSRVFRYCPVNFIPSVLHYQENDDDDDNKLRHKVAQEALRLRCVRSAWCGVLLQKTLNHVMGFYGVAFSSNASNFCILLAVSQSYIHCSIVSLCHTPTLKFHGPPQNGRKR